MRKTKKRTTSQKKFFELLSKTRGWKVTDVDQIRTSRKNLDETCPVCAVANKILHKAEYDLDHIDAARAIGLDTEFAQKVADAADNRGHDKLRKKLIKTVGIND